MVWNGVDVPTSDRKTERAEAVAAHVLRFIVPNIHFLCKFVSN